MSSVAPVTDCQVPFSDFCHWNVDWASRNLQGKGENSRARRSSAWEGSQEKTNRVTLINLQALIKAAFEAIRPKRAEKRAPEARVL
jgi:hypothetical protein